MASALSETLRAFNKRHGKDTSGDTPLNKENTEEDEEFLKETYLKFKGKDKEYGAIPKFYSKLPAENDTLKLKFFELTRASFAQRRGAELVDNEELQKLWQLLEENPTPPDSGDEQMISFTNFMKLKDQMSDKCSVFFTAKVFSKMLRSDPYGRIPITQLFSYIMRKVWLQQTRIGLSLFDVQGLGFLKETPLTLASRRSCTNKQFLHWQSVLEAILALASLTIASVNVLQLKLLGCFSEEVMEDLESYILELIPSLPQLRYLEESFYSFYVCTAVRKFFFFLDPVKTGKIKIVDILACGFLDDLLELRDEDLSPESLESNWFSAASSLRIYGDYLRLDTDRNGMLSKRELSRYGTGNLTSLYVDRVFQECLTYEGEVDYKTYLDFVLAMENKKEPQSLQYMFKLLDIHGHGYLDPFTLNYFFRGIQEQLKSLGHEPVRFEDIQIEIFDIVRPASPNCITLQDLISSSQGDTVMNILTDLEGFLNYENREAILAENQ